MTNNYFGSKDFFFEVAKGNVPGHSINIKFGENPDVDSAAAEDIWDFGGIYIWSTTAAIDSLSNSDNSDIQDTVVIGLDENWEEVIQTKKLTGQTRAALDTPLVRVNRMYNNGDTDYAGDIYCYENTALTDGVPDDTSKIRAMIRDGNNQTLMVIYTVPAGKTAFFIQALPTVVKASPVAIAAEMTLRMREYGKVFRVRGKLGLITTGANGLVKPYRAPVRIEEKTDVIVRCDNISADNVGIAASLDFIIVDNEYIGDL